VPKKEFSMNSSYDEVADISKNVRTFCEKNKVQDVECDQIEICLTEALNNVIKHSYKGEPDKPIVVIGAMKTSSEENWDGPKNLTDAIHICSNVNSREMGVLVCLNGEINAASEVTKTHTEDIETFHSLDFGALGFVEKERVWFNRLPKRLEVVETNKINSNVDIIKVYAGIKEKLFMLIADTEIDGLVVEALGVGNVPPPAFEGIKYVLSKNIPVVLVSRCPAGETLDTYSYAGAGKWLKESGVIFSDYLNGQKARIKLMLALGANLKGKELSAFFDN